MPQLFGTDGVRGRAGDYPLDPKTVARLGAALVRAMQAVDRPLRIIIGRDTRESGDWIERELARGAGSVGADISSAGVVPTPAIAYVTREMGFDVGIVISASHNPFHDNGIKVFSGRGEKFGEASERAVFTTHHIEQRFRFLLIAERAKPRHLRISGRTIVGRVPHAANDTACDDGIAKQVHGRDE